MKNILLLFLYHIKYKSKLFVSAFHFFQPNITDFNQTYCHCEVFFIKKKSC